MKYVILLIALCLLASAAAAEPKVSLDLKGAPIDQALTNISKQAGLPVIAASDVKAAVTITLNDASVEQAVTAIALSNNLKWRKIQFAMSDKSQVSAEVMAKAIAEIEAVPVPGLIISDNEKKTQTVFGKGLPVVDALPQLPEGFKWQTVYLVQNPPAAKKDDAKNKPANELAQKMNSLNQERLNLFMMMTPDQRSSLIEGEMNMMLNFEPGMRHDMMRGWAQGIGQMDQQTRQGFFQEMGQIMQELNPQQ